MAPETVSTWSTRDLIKLLLVLGTSITFLSGALRLWVGGFSDGSRLSVPVYLDSSRSGGSFTCSSSERELQSCVSRFSESPFPELTPIRVNRESGNSGSNQPLETNAANINWMPLERSVSLPAVGSENAGSWRATHGGVPLSPPEYELKQAVDVTGATPADTRSYSSAPLTSEPLDLQDPRKLMNKNTTIPKWHPLTAHQEVEFQSKTDSGAIVTSTQVTTTISRASVVESIEGSL